MRLFATPCLADVTSEVRKVLAWAPQPSRQEGSGGNKSEGRKQQDDMTESVCAICNRPVAGSERIIVVDRDINGVTHRGCFREGDRATSEHEPGSASRAGIVQHPGIITSRNDTSTATRDLTHKHQRSALSHAGRISRGAHSP